VEYKSCIPINKVREYFIGFALHSEEEEEEEEEEEYVWKDKHHLGIGANNYYLLLILIKSKFEPIK